MQEPPIFDFNGTDIGFPLPFFNVNNQRAGEGFLYILAFGDMVKIGQTTKPRNRIAEHRRSSIDRQGPLHRAWISPPHLRPRETERAVVGFGKTVRYWVGVVREGDGLTGETRTHAHLLGGHTPVVWITGAASCIALTHVEAVGGEA